MKEIYVLCLSLILRNMRFAVPPTVALMKYMKNGIHTFADFPQTWRFSLYIINIVGRFREAAVGGAGAGDIIFLTSSSQTFI